MMWDALSFFRPWRRKKIGILFSAQQVPLMTSTCCSVLLYSLGFLRAIAPLDYYEINDYPYNKGYYLADGICIQCSTFVKTIREPREEKNRRFAKQ
jgi:hypothetical protein